ncbi:MAG: helix-turn-helix domain-containing protein [Prevotella sp.]|nr:helix-turn-helix domain-containing protein [Prevotella sp.]
MKRISRLLLMLMAVLTSPAVAQNTLLEQYVVSNIDLSTGLPHNRVNDIFADSNGFIWISTYGGGLARYDGYSFFRPGGGLSSSQLGKPASLVQGRLEGSASCTSIAEDKAQRLWVTYDEGTSVIDLKTMQPVVPESGDSTIQALLSEAAVKVCCDSQGVMWLVTWSSVYRFTMDEQGKISHVSRYAYKGNLPYITISDVEENGSVWACVDGGLYRLVERGEQLVREDIAPAMQRVNGLFITDLLRRGNSVWISTNEGLFDYDIYQHQLKEYRHTDDPHSLSHQHVSCLAVTADNHLLVGTLSGISILDEQTGTFERWNSCSSPVPMSSDFVHCVLMREGQLWVGTETGGIIKLVPRQLMLTNYTHGAEPTTLSPNPVNAMYVEPDGTLWAGTVEGGLNRKKPGETTFTHLTTHNSQLTHNSVSVLTPSTGMREADDATLLWVGTWGGGVNVIDLKQPNVVKPVDMGMQNPLVRYVGAMAYDPYNNGLWIGSNDGVFFYNFETHLLDKPFEHNQDIRGCIGSIVTRDGQLWMGCMSGVIVVDLKGGRKSSGQFSMRALRYKLDNPASGVIEKISCFCEMDDGTLWLGSNAYGLYRRMTAADTGEEQFECLTTRDGLAHDAVKGIVEDSRHRLWITTSHGLSIYDTRARTFINYTEADGLCSSHFYWNSAVRSSDGTIFLGSEHGLTEVRGDNAAKGNKGCLRFTRLTVDNQEAAAGGDYLDEDISVARRITLAEGYKSFSIDFSALNYVGDAQGTYYYRMKGYESEWIRLPRGEHSVRYTALPAGSYTFEVRYVPSWVESRDNTTDVDVIDIDINVTPYFWKSWWFTLLLVAGAIAAIIYIYNRRVQQLKRQEADRLLTPIREVLDESKNPEQLQMRIKNILNAQERYRESFQKTAEAEQQAALRQEKPFMERVMQVMEQNYANSDFGVTEFCEAIGMSRSLISKRLNTETGQSTGQFIRSYRLNIARELLLKNDVNRNITEIAYKVGFNDPKYFTRCFVKMYGVSPSTFTETSVEDKKEETEG